MNLNKKITLIFVLVLILSGIFIGLFQYYQLSSNIEKRAKKNSEELIYSVQNIIANELNNAVDIATLTAKMIEKNPTRKFIYDLINQPTLENRFALTLFIFDGFDGYLNNTLSWQPGNAYAPKESIWYISAINNDYKAYFTSPYNDTVTNEMLISIVIASKNKNTGEPLGVSLFDISLHKLNKVLNSVSFGTSGYSFLINKYGTIISHPNIEFNGKKINTFLGDVKIKLATQLLDRNGEKVLLTFSKIEGYEWYLGTVAKQHKEIKSIYDLEQFPFTLPIVFFLIFTIIFNILIKRVLKPLVIPLEEMAHLLSQEDISCDHRLSDLSKNLNLFLDNNT